MKKTLIVMAAGLGSRYGGLKQITPVGANGEILADYAIYDAKRAGFDRAVCIIKPEHENDFRELFSRVDFPIDYAYQTPDHNPPPERTKPWGTGHAVLCCKDIVKEPFCVINADDFYGLEAYQAISDFLAGRGVPNAPSGIPDYCLAGYRIETTLTENGTVARGICGVDSENNLTEINERLKLIRESDGVIHDRDSGVTVNDGSFASMNMWGFTESLFGHLETLFKDFLAEKHGDIKAEFLLPTAVGSLIDSGQAAVKVLPVSCTWYGMTYKEDREPLARAIADMTKAGQYPAKLWT
ncbi:MAG: nucleotidyltransferase [Oscillospiraceae bacterium]|nr:nucleotidyltransferase [Oscillospiraceae bacterium]